jgi:hypothetical protein
MAEGPLFAFNYDVGALVTWTGGRQPAGSDVSRVVSDPPETPCETQ